MERKCYICARSFSGETMAGFSSHLRKHEREGITKDGEKGEFKWWGYVSRTDAGNKIVTVRTVYGPHSSMALKRSNVEGIVNNGDAVRLEFRGSAGRENSYVSGSWYAVPLGYKADWIERKKS